MNLLLFLDQFWKIIHLNQVLELICLSVDLCFNDSFISVNIFLFISFSFLDDTKKWFIYVF